MFQVQGVRRKALIMNPIIFSSAKRAGRGVLLLGMAACALAATSAYAKTGDRNQPMNTSQDHLDGFNAPNTITTLTGNVLVTQGTMKAKGDVAKIYLDAATQVARIVMTGKPHAHIEQLDDDNNLMTGEAPTLDYDNINGIAVLYPNAVVIEQNTGEARADKITYDTNTTHFTGVGNVSAIYYPKQKPEKDSSAQPGNAKPASTSSASAIPASHT
jgi:lipopolysaccharide export system protein LptA